MTKIELTDRQLKLVEESLEHSIQSGQFFFLMEETEILRDILCKIQKTTKEEKSNV